MQTMSNIYYLEPIVVDTPQHSTAQYSTVVYVEYTTLYHVVQPNIKIKKTSIPDQSAGNHHPTQAYCTPQYSTVGGVVLKLSSKYCTVQ